MLWRSSRLFFCPALATNRQHVSFIALRLRLPPGRRSWLPLLIPAAVGVHWWNIVLLLIAGVLPPCRGFRFTRREVTLMGLGRAALFGLLLMTLSGTLAWNLILGVSGLLLVIYVYRREGRSTGARTFLGMLRTGLIAFVLVLLNNPILSRIRTIVEPSVVAVLVDDSLSMSIRDVNPADASAAATRRFEAAVNLFTDEDQALIRKLAKVHTLQFYSFDQSANSGRQGFRS